MVPDAEDCSRGLGRRRVTVCHVTTVHEPFDARVFHRECRALAEAGYDVHLVACGVEDGTVHGVRIHGLPVPPNRLARMFLWPWKALRVALAQRPALLHFHDPELLPVAWLLRRTGRRVVYDVHENVAADIGTKPYLPRWLRPLVAGGYRLLEASLAAGMPTVQVLDRVARRYREPKVVVRNLPLAGPRPPLPKPPPGRPARLVYVGTVSSDRGALALVALAAELRRRGAEAVVRIVGPVHERGLAEALRRRIAEDDLAAHVALDGPVRYDRVRSVLGEADLGLCLLEPTPNYANALPAKILDYMAAGLPVVASDLPAWRQYVFDTGAGVMVDPGDVPAIAGAVQDLLSDPGRLREMSERGRAAVESTYCWERERPALLGFYRRVLGGRP